MIGPDEVGRVVETASSGRPGDGEPVVANHGEQDITRGDTVGRSIPGENRSQSGSSRHPFPTLDYPGQRIDGQTFPCQRCDSFRRASIISDGRGNINGELPCGMGDSARKSNPPACPVS